ncbi:MAG: hypothetical protein ACREPT_05265 [Rudaea sp.]
MASALTWQDYAIIAALLLMLYSGIAGVVRANANASIERKLDAIIEHFNIQLSASAPGNLSAEVRAAADAGKMIDAIRKYRLDTGAGLKAAQSAVQAYVRARKAV